MRDKSPFQIVCELVKPKSVLCHMKTIVDCGDDGLFFGEDCSERRSKSISYMQTLEHLYGLEFDLNSRKFQYKENKMHKKNQKLDLNFIDHLLFRFFFHVVGTHLSRCVCARMRAHVCACVQVCEKNWKEFTNND